LNSKFAKDKLMTILFLDGFDHYTSFAQKYEIVTSPPAINSSAARTGSGGMVPAPTIGGPNLKLLSAANEHATLIVGAAFRRIGTPGSHWLFDLCSDTGGTQHLVLQIDATGKLTVRRGSQVSGTILGTESGASFSVLNTWHYVELKALLSDTVGTIEVRIDGNTTPVILLTAQDTKNAGTKTVFDSVAPAQDQSAGFHMDDFYICNGAGSVNNDFLGDIKIDTLLPNNNGFSSALLGSDGNSTDNYLLVDETPPNTTDYVSSATVDQKDTYAFSNTTVSGTVMGVQINSFAQKNDAGTRQIAHVTRRTIDYDSADMTVGQGFGYYRTLQETDPSTSAAWTTAGVDAAEFGVKVR
jgi:hypothetical protein